MLDPNYSLIVLEHRLQEHRHWLTKEIESGQQLKQFLTERPDAIDRARQYLGKALISLGMRVQGQLPDVAGRSWVSHWR